MKTFKAVVKETVEKYGELALQDEAYKALIDGFVRDLSIGDRQRRSTKRRKS